MAVVAEALRVARCFNPGRVSLFAVVVLLSAGRISIFYRPRGVSLLSLREQVVFVADVAGAPFFAVVAGARFLFCCRPRGGGCVLFLLSLRGRWCR